MGSNKKADLLKVYLAFDLMEVNKSMGVKLGR
jgi:hypothetical protein